MIEVKNVSKHFGPIKAVDNISFNLKPGEITALLGPNGAGKTTLMRLLTFYLAPTGGTISINNLSEKEALNIIGYVPENAPLYNDMTVYDALLFSASIRSTPVENIHHAVKSMNLEPVINQKISQLSKGYKRRTAIAQAILHNPQILILDEPTEGLDPNQKFELRNFLKNYGKSNIVLVSTHIMEEVEAYATRVLLINEGKLIKDTTPTRLRSLFRDDNLEASFRKLTKGSIK